MRVTTTPPSWAEANARDAMCRAIPPTSPSAQLDLAGVDGGSDLQVDRGQAVGQTEGAAQRSSRRVERRQDAIAGRLHQVAVPAGDLGANDLVVAIQNSPPATVPHGRRLLRRANDVREQDGGQNPVDVLGRVERPDLLVGPRVLLLVDA